MKLHALEIPFAVTDPHNLTAGAAGSDVKLGRERRRVNHQRVIAGHRQGIIQPLKHPFAVMLDKRGFAMHHLGRPHDSRAKRLGDRLMPETDAQQRRFFRHSGG